MYTLPLKILLLRTSPLRYFYILKLYFSISTIYPLKIIYSPYSITSCLVQPDVVKQSELVDLSCGDMTLDFSAEVDETNVTGNILYSLGAWVYMIRRFL